MNHRPPPPPRAFTSPALGANNNNDLLSEPHYLPDFTGSHLSRDNSQGNTPYPASYFDDAYQPSPSPPPPFLDIPLNLQNQPGYYLPFPPDRRQPSPPRPLWRDRVRQPDEFPPIDFHCGDPLAMAPPTRSSRLPNGYVDLTSDESPNIGVTAPQRLSKRRIASPGPSSKRMKRADGTAAPVKGESPEAKIEEIDLSDDKPIMQDVLQKQRVEAVKARQNEEEPATTFRNFTCVICMDTPTDLTATSCGHLFCHTCLMEALIAGENRSAPNEPKRSQCPVCRKHIVRTKATDIIPLLLKKALATQPRKSSAVTSPRQQQAKVT